MHYSCVEWLADPSNGCLQCICQCRSRRANIYATASRIYSVIETSEVIYITITDHSKTAGSITHRHTTTRTCWIRQYIVYTLPPNAPQAEWMTQSIIETHISSFRAHICTLLDRIDTTLSYHRIPNGITPHIYLFPLRRRHVHSSIGIHAHTSCECPSYQ